MTNIYLELELNLDPPSTDADAIKMEINQKVTEWAKLVGTDVKYQPLINKANTYLIGLPSNLQGQAEEAKNTQIKKLREEIRNLSSSGDLLQFEVQYLTKTYSCFQVRTVQDEIKNLSRNLIDERGVSSTSGTNIPPVSSVMETFSATFDTFRTHLPLPKEKSKFIGACFLAVLLIGVVLYYVCSLPSFFSVLSIPSLSSTSYQRGVGPHIVRYANRNYTKKEWNRVDTSGVNVSGTTIRGWDKNRFSVYSHYENNFFSFKDGIFTENNAGSYIRSLFYSNQDSIYVVTTNRIRIYESESYRDTTTSNANFPDRVFHLCDSEYLFVSPVWDFKCFLLNNEMLLEMSRQDTLKRFGQFFVDKNGNMGMPFFFQPQHGIAAREGLITKCENDQWSEHYKTTHNGNIFSLWAIDFNNFVLVGGDITVFRDGKESHPLVGSAGPYSFDRNNCLAVWGNSMDRFWVMDNTGGVAEFVDGKAGEVIIPGNFNNITAHWVSPEGVV